MFNEGHCFVCTGAKTAVLLHGSANTPLPGTIQEADDKKITETYCTLGINKVNEFIAGSELYPL